MHNYRSLDAWQKAHSALLLVLRATDASYHPRCRALFDQLRRAAISTEANIVEGYALGTLRYFQQHMRIALGSAAEAECLGRVARELGYLPEEVVRELERLLGSSMRALHGLIRRARIPRRPTPHAPRPVVVTPHAL